MCLKIRLDMLKEGIEGRKGQSIDNEMNEMIKAADRRADTGSFQTSSQARHWCCHAWPRH